MAFPFLIGGGGLAQINDNLLDGAINPSEVAKGDFKSFKNIKRQVIIDNLTKKNKYNPAWFLTFGDDPYDQQWVAYGYGLYKHSKV